MKLHAAFTHNHKNIFITNAVVFINAYQNYDVIRCKPASGAMLFSMHMHSIFICSYVCICVKHNILVAEMPSSKITENFDCCLQSNQHFVQNLEFKMVQRHPDRTCALLCLRIQQFG